MALEDSEFGGHAGLIQPAPHVVVGAEAAMLERMVNPDDDQDTVARVLADILSGKSPTTTPPADVEILPLRPDVTVATVLPTANGFGIVGVGNQDLRTVRLKASSSRRMDDAVYGPEKQIAATVLPVVSINIGVAPGHWFYQIVMNGIQVTDVDEVDVVA